MRLADMTSVSEPSDYILDLQTPAAKTPAAAAPAPKSATASGGNPGGHSGGHSGGTAVKHASRPWLAVHWRCCHTYSRIYRNRDATAYVGRCPACGKVVKATIGPGGVNNRFFQAY
jgi:hypothetical protein